MEELNDLLQRAEKLGMVISMAKDIKEIRAPAFTKAEREMRAEIADLLVRAAKKDPKNRNCYVGAIAYNYEQAGEYNKGKRYRQEFNERSAGRWNSDNPKFHSLMLEDHLDKLDYEDRVKYLSKVLDKPRLLSKNLKNAIYNKVEGMRESIEESYRDDVSEIRHNYGICEDTSEPRAQANYRYDKDMRVLKGLYDRVSKIKKAAQNRGEF